MKRCEMQCDQFAEVEWTSSQGVHHLCSFHMGLLWEQITKQYQGSKTVDASAFSMVEKC